VTLKAGTRLGSYEVLSLIGQGGMGEVYRARDTSLKRDVALKILPDTFADHPTRVARFRREAAVLASLNHSGIAAIYGLVEGPDSKLAIALELVEGESLANRIARGPLPLTEAIPLARQIAEAMAAAHAQGVIHRDLKPHNIVVRTDGTAKVLDFGLAKAISEEAIGASGMAVTETAIATAIGVVLGTPAYMSPEQATGGAVDARTDIWAFGCVLFEMLAGQRAFDGATTSETLTAVLSRPPDWKQLPATTPTALRTLLRRCLATEPRRRPPAEAVAFALEDEQAFGSSDSFEARPRPQRSWTLAAAGVIAGALLTGGVMWTRTREAAPTVLRTAIPVSASVMGADRSFAFTTDGSRRLIYVSEDGSELLARPLDALESTPLFTTAAYLRGIFPSPDGRSLAFIENSFTLRRIPAAGGTPVTVLVFDGPSRGAVWMPGETFVFATSLPETGLQQVSAAGGTPTVLTKPDRSHGELDHIWPERLPGKQAVLFTILPTQGATPRVAVLDLANRTWRTVVEGAVRGRYLDSGHLVYTAGGSLWAVRFDLSRMETVGATVEVVPRGSMGAVAQFDISNDGALVYPRAVRQMGTDLTVPTWVDRHGSETPLSIAPGNYRHPRLSPKGDRLAIATESGGGDIFLANLTQKNTQLSRLTFRDEEDWMPVWMPDGNGIVFGSRSGGGVSNLFSQRLDDGKVVRLTQSTDMQCPTGITPDGRTLLLHRFPFDVQSVALSAGSKPVTLIESPVEERNATLSHDGRWMAYEAETPGRPGELNVYVRPYPDVGRRVWQITASGGTFPAWSASGRELYYQKPDGTMTATAIEADANAISVRNSVDLFRGRYLGRDGTHYRQYDVAPDGRFLMLKYQRDTAQGHFVFVQNFTTELSRLLPN
jgi:serine/threonine-protein kinase